jgi:hypothetical protein
VNGLFSAIGVLPTVGEMAEQSSVTPCKWKKFFYGVISNAVPPSYRPKLLVTPNRCPLPSRVSP